jgi:hypothetical protein
MCIKLLEIAIWRNAKALSYDKHIPGPVMAGLLPIGYKPMDNDSRKVGVQKVKSTEPMDDEGSPISFVA